MSANTGSHSCCGACSQCALTAALHRLTTAHMNAMLQGWTPLHLHLCCHALPRSWTEVFCQYFIHSETRLADSPVNSSKMGRFQQINRGIPQTCHVHFPLHSQGLLYLLLQSQSGIIV